MLAVSVFVQRCPHAASSPPPLPLHSALPRPIQLCSSKRQPDPRRRNGGASREKKRAAARAHPPRRPTDGRHQAQGAVLPHLPAHPVLQRQVRNRPPLVGKSPAFFSFLPGWFASSKISGFQDFVSCFASCEFV